MNTEWIDVDPQLSVKIYPLEFNSLQIKSNCIYNQSTKNLIIVINLTHPQDLSLSLCLYHYTKPGIPNRDKAKWDTDVLTMGFFASCRNTFANLTDQLNKEI